MVSVWDLTEKEQGDHVLVALSIPEAKALIRSVCFTAGEGKDDEDMQSAAKQVHLGLRDQKGIEGVSPKPVAPRTPHDVNPGTARFVIRSAPFGHVTWQCTSCPAWGTSSTETWARMDAMRHCEEAREAERQEQK